MSNLVKKIFTLILIRDLEGNKILLGYKKRGFGKGKWNGLGGKVEYGESVDECAKREVKEESGLNMHEAKKVAIIEFKFENKLNEIMQVHLFTSHKFSGELIESDEMLPRWFSLNEIPFDQMWSDDRIWMPYFLSNTLFKACFHFDCDEKTIIAYEITEVLSL